MILPKIDEIGNNGTFNQLKDFTNEIISKLKPIEEALLREAYGPKVSAAVPYTGFQFNAGLKTDSAQPKEKDAAQTDVNGPEKAGNDEEELYAVRAKGFKFSNNEWKDHGVGDVKIMRSKKDPFLKRVAFKNSIKEVFNFAIGKGMVFTKEQQKNRGLIRFTAILDKEIGPENLTFKVNSAVLDILHNKLQDLANED